MVTRELKWITTLIEGNIRTGSAVRILSGYRINDQEHGDQSEQQPSVGHVDPMQSLSLSPFVGALSLPSLPFLGGRGCAEKFFRRWFRLVAPAEKTRKIFLDGPASAQLTVEISVLSPLTRH